MTVTEAIKIVLDLARQNRAPFDMPDERDRQSEACDLVQEFAAGLDEMWTKFDWSDEHGNS